MEGNRVMMMMSGLLVVVAVLGQIQVGAAARVCCPDRITKHLYNACLKKAISRTTCASTVGCPIVDDGNCPATQTNEIRENASSSVSEYCKLGCVSSVCGAITTLQLSDASEVVSGAVEKCNDACSSFCTKDSVATVETTYIMKRWE